MGSPSVPPPSELAARLAALRAKLERAAAEVGAIAADPLFLRIAEVFRRMPAEDREALLGVLERQVTLRRHAEVVEGVSGMTLRPNPNARLYVRVHDAELNKTPLDGDDWVLLALRAVRAFPSVVTPDFFPIWRAALAEAIELAEPVERAAFERAMRAILDIYAARRMAIGDEPTGTD
ncbi:MAG: hypothetical protein U0807_11580 [Candidatus Binatia bacterium]